MPTLLGVQMKGEHAEQLPQDEGLAVHGKAEVGEGCHLLGVHLLLKVEFHQSKQRSSEPKKGKFNTSGGTCRRY